jgi:WD40 repeat protein
MSRAVAALTSSPNWFAPSVASLSPSGALLAYGANERVQLLRTSSATHLMTLRCDSDTDRVVSVVFSRRQANLIFVATHTARVSLWCVGASPMTDDAIVEILLTSTMLPTNSSIARVIASHVVPSAAPLVAVDCGVDAFVGACEGGLLISWPAMVDFALLSGTEPIVWRFRRCQVLTERLAADEQLSIVACSTAERGVVAVGTTNGRVFLVDCGAADGAGALLVTLQVHAGRVEGLQFQPLLHCRSRLLLASSGSDGVVAVLAQDVSSNERGKCTIVARLTSGDETQQPTAADAKLAPLSERAWHAVAWSPTESNVIVSGGPKGSLLRWQLSRRRCERLPSPHRRPVFAVLFGGNVMVTHALDRLVACWDACDWRVVASTSGLGGYCVALSTSIANASRLVGAVGDGALRVWDVGAARREELFQRKLAAARELASLDAALELLILPRGKMCSVSVLWRGFDRATLTAMVCHPDRPHVVAVGRADGVVQLYDIDQEENLATFKSRHDNSPVRQLSWRRFRAADEEATAATADIADGEQEESDVARYALYSLSQVSLLEHNLEQPRKAAIDMMPSLRQRNGLAIHCAQWSASGEYLALGHDAGVLAVVHCEDGVESPPFMHTAATGMDTSAIRCVEWFGSEDNGLLLATGSERGEVRVLELLRPLRQLRLRAVLKAHHLAVCSLCWRPKLPATLLSGSADGTVQVWSLDAAMNEQRELLDAVAAGEADFDSSVARFEEDRRAFVANYRGHGGHVLAVAWSPIDGDLAFSGSGDQSLHMWRPSAQTERTADVALRANKRKRRAKKR